MHLGWMLNELGNFNFNHIVKLETISEMKPTILISNKEKYLKLLRRNKSLNSILLFSCQNNRFNPVLI